MTPTRPDYSLQFGPGLSSPSPADLTNDLLARLVMLLSANPGYYPWSTIPPDGKAFDQVGVINTPVSGGGAPPSPGIETEVVRITCPLGYQGIVLGISNNFLGANFNPGLPSLTWRIRNGVSLTNSQFVDGYSSIPVEFGTTEFPRVTSGIFIDTGQTLIYTVTNNDPAIPVDNTTQVACCFRGFFWPVQRNVGVSR